MRISHISGFVRWLIVISPVFFSAISHGDPAKWQTRDEAIRAHVAAIEASGQKSPEAFADQLAAGHLAPGFLAETAVGERRKLFERIQAAAADARGALLDEADGEITLTLEGQESIDVSFRLEAEAPFRIVALHATATSERETAISLDWSSASDIFRDLEQQGFSGVVHLARDGKAVLHEAYGKSNRELGYDSRIDTIYGIGSAPIDFTVAGIYLLEQRGKLRLDDGIGRFFKEVPADKQSMTVRHLLQGRSGLPDFHDIPDLDWDPDLAWIDRHTAVARILAQPLLFAPGTEAAHSHSAFGLAAAIIEVVSKQSYFEFLQKEFFNPSGMTRTGMYGSGGDLAVRDFAAGYGPSSVGLPNIPPNWGPASWLVIGSGGMYSTLDDMLRFFAYVRSGNALEEDYASRFRGDGVGIGGSNRGFYIFHAYSGQAAEAMMIINGEGRAPLVQSLAQALEELVMAN